MTSKNDFFKHIINGYTFKGKSITLGAATLNSKTQTEAPQRKSSKSRSQRQNPIVKVLTSATFIRAVFGILKKVV